MTRYWTFSFDYHKNTATFSA